VRTLSRVAVRPATENDLEALGVFPDRRAYFRHRLKCQGSGAGLLLIALHGGTPVGDVFLEFEPDATEYERPAPDLVGVPLLQRLEVLPEHRNRGIGTKLLRRCERELRSRGHARMVLGVSPDNQMAIRLYLRLGYTWYPEPDLPTLTNAVIYTWNADETRTASGTEPCILMIKALTSENRTPVGAVAAVSAMG
jgi:GNAT superfamily N-acetyltransferase